MIAEPGTAPPRTDLPFLKYRGKPRPAAATPAAAAASPAAAGQSTAPTRSAGGGSAVADFIGGRSVHPARTAGAAAPAPASRPISFDRPGRTTRPTSAPPTPAPAAPGGSLDLSETPAAPVAGGATAARRAAKVERRALRGLTLPPGRAQLLTVNDPTARLTRVQSGIGQLTIEAACSPDVGDLRLGAAYQLADGTSSTVQYAAGGNRYAPSSRRPVIVGGRDEFEHLRLDLRQTPGLARMTVYAFSEARSELHWGGTLVITTFGGGRAELPLESLYAGTTAVLISVYNVAGELLVRAEMETVVGDVREAARAYGYDRITWRDDRNPVD